MKSSLQIPFLFLFFCMTGLFLASAGPVCAEIYKYIDKDGVLHFTDRPNETGFHLYIDREERRPGVSYPSGLHTSRYDHWIDQAARKYNISFALLKAMIKVESDFNTAAVSRAGAKGLMQIMPQNFRHLGINDPFNPSENIMGGTRYFRALLDRFNGRLQLALAAYNAGPNVVDDYGRIPPYPETMAYIKRVMKYYIVYK
ncbi:MAG: lytic transglycosylase domain-containing protein [Thermodesulfobacteriota bacterium]|nr:lytic transglycosylase domain-containing protein [Thermodesulfobacteriota bacterium]